MNPKHLAVTIEDNITSDKIRLRYDKQLSDRQKYEELNNVSKSTGQAFQKYYVETKVFYTTFNITSECNDITFINNGTTALTIDNVPLQPNQSLRISGNRGEIDTTLYQLTFATPINTGNQLIVIRKLYI